MNHYQELYKLNNQTLKSLTGNYLPFAKAYIKEARKKGAKNEDTELLIQNVLTYLLDNNLNGVNFNHLINDEETFKQEALAQIPQKFVPRFSKREVFAIIVFCVLFLSFIVITNCLKRDNYFASPVNIVVSTTEEGLMKITWNDMYYTDNGYTVYYIGSDGVKSYEQVVFKNECFFEITSSQTYDIYVKVNSTDLIKESSYAKVTYNFIVK